MKKSFFILLVDLFWKKATFFHQHNKSSCKYFSVTTRKLRVNVSAILKNEELIGLSYWKSEQLSVSERRAHRCHLTLPAALDVHSLYSSQLRTKPKRGSCIAFQAVERGLQILQGNEKIMLITKSVLCFTIQVLTEMRRLQTTTSFETCSLFSFFILKFNH